MQLLNQNDFLKKYNINEEDFSASGLLWADLQAIYLFYNQQKTSYENIAQYLTNILIKVNNVHSIRYRVKDSEHLIEKIIRKKVENLEREITKENYLSEITDIIGIRAIHLFKDQWTTIHTAITEKWNLKESPIVYIREGDNVAAYRDKFKEYGLEIKTHDAGYRSLHYIVETQPEKIKYFIEIQVRTIFEEGWSEIDHKIRYPYNTNNKMYNDFLSILNRLAGSADEMGSFIINLTPTLEAMKENYNEKLHEKEIAIEELEKKIDSLEISQNQKAELNSDLNKINKLNATSAILNSLNGWANLAEEQVNVYLEEAVSATSGDDGWAYIGEVGTYLKRFTPINYRDYGYYQLGPFLKSKSQFELKNIKKSERALYADSTYIRLKNNANKSAQQ